MPEKESRGYGRDRVPCNHWKPATPPPSPAEQEWGEQGFCIQRTQTSSLSSVPGNCVVCTCDGIYPGCLGPRHPSGEEVRCLASTCALPEALAPLILRKKQAFMWRVDSVQIHMRGKFVVFTSGSSAVTVALSFAPEGQASLILKENYLWYTSPCRDPALENC